MRGTAKGVVCPQQHLPARCALLSGRDRMVLSPLQPTDTHRPHLQNGSMPLQRWRIGSVIQNLSVVK
jgi:hypothetical protein